MIDLVRNSYLLLMVFWVSMFSQLQSQWVWQNPKPVGNDLYSVVATSREIAYAVGAVGTIIKTNDGGETWTIQKSNTFENLKDIFFIDENTGWTCGTNGTIMKTLDGGESWRAQTTYNDIDLNSVYFSSSRQGVAVGGSRLDYLNYNSVILTTTDGGNTWISQNSNSEWPLKSVVFIDENTGWAVGGVDGNKGLEDACIILKTIDRGNNWLPQMNSGYLCFNDVHFINDSIGYVVGYGGIILKTIDGGANWTDVGTDIWHSPYGVYFKSDSDGIVVGGDLNWPSVILATKDGAQTWEQKSTVGMVSELYSVSFWDSEIGYVVGASGNILKTSDGGEKWAKKKRSYTRHSDRIRFVHFFDRQHGIVSGSNLMESRDGGRSWTDITPDNVIRTSMFCINENTWYAVGSNWISLTKDGGVTWKTTDPLPLDYTTVGYLKVFFVDENCGWVVGNTITEPSGALSARLLKTDDGGDSWTRGRFYERDVRAIFFVNKTVGWVLGPDGLVMKTNDGGETWEKKYPTTTQQTFNDMFFVNESTGLLVGMSVILKTEDGGENWTVKDGVQQQDFRSYNSVFFVDGSTFWVVGAYGLIKHTNDGGETWSEANPITNNDLYDIHWFDKSHGWIVGNRGLILSTNTGGIDSGLDNSANTGFELYQNYPNPFNNSTTIEYQLSNDSHVELTVYNVLGQVVRHLLDAEQEKGKHRIRWDGKFDSGRQVGSGLYIYQVIFEQKRITRKMLLLR